MILGMYVLIASKKDACRKIVTANIAAVIVTASVINILVRG